MKAPKVGDKMYIPGSYHISRGEDDVDGGLATISHVEISENLPLDHINSIMVKFKELSQITSYNYKILLEEQNELEQKYKGIAKPNPDVNTPWIEKGDLVNGQVYQGKTIW